MYSSPHGHPARPMVQEKDKLPMLVPVRIRAVSMWYFRDCPVLAPDRPRRLARISPGLSVDCSLPSFIEIEPDVANRKRPLPAIRDGQRIIANLWHNRLNNFYLVHSYVLADRHRQPGERDDQYQLTNRLQLGTSSAAETTNQVFLVKVNNSIFKDFYSCEPLGFALISDPKRLLRNASPAEHLGGFPVWICIEADELRLARCRITALADVSTNYSRRDRSGLHSDIRGHGILIVGSKGIVFSRDHPQTRVRLLPSDRRRVTVGEQFLFSATFYGLKKGFIVSGIQRLNEQDDDYFEEIESFYLGGDDILFVQELRTHMRQWAAEGHDSPDFGPVADPGELVREYVQKNEINWPELIDVFVCYNAGWVPGESTLMKVHSLLDETDDEVINNMIKSKKNRKKLDAQGTVSSGQSSCPASSSSTDDIEDECECLQKWSILRELTNEEQATKQLEPELFHRLVELRNEFSSLIARTVNA
uniref:Uncharacterized protein n=1 Tax=Globodera pallida TaxID=36090 RepID=A0A183CI40_GLOPA